jgi:hypothetical protein
VVQLERHRSTAEKVLVEIVKKMNDELRTWLRAIFLSVLFTPVIVTAPVCVSLGWYWREWVDLLRWTLEHAGRAFSLGFLLRFSIWSYPSHHALWAGQM